MSSEEEEEDDENYSNSEDDESSEEEEEEDSSGSDEEDDSSDSEEVDEGSASDDGGGDVKDVGKDSTQDIKIQTMNLEEIERRNKLNLDVATINRISASMDRIRMRMEYKYITLPERQQHFEDIYRKQQDMQKKTSTSENHSGFASEQQPEGEREDLEEQALNESFGNNTDASGEGGLHTLNDEESSFESQESVRKIEDIDQLNDLDESEIFQPEEENEIRTSDSLLQSEGRPDFFLEKVVGQNKADSTTNMDKVSVGNDQAQVELDSLDGDTEVPARMNSSNSIKSSTKKKRSLVDLDKDSLDDHENEPKPERLLQSSPSATLAKKDSQSEISPSGRESQENKSDSPVDDRGGGRKLPGSNVQNKPSDDENKSLNRSRSSAKSAGMAASTSPPQSNTKDQTNNRSNKSKSKSKSKSDLSSEVDETNDADHGPSRPSKTNSLRREGSSSEKGEMATEDNASTLSTPTDDQANDLKGNEKDPRTNRKSSTDSERTNRVQPNETKRDDKVKKDDDDAKELADSLEDDAKELADSLEDDAVDKEMLASWDNDMRSFADATVQSPTSEKALIQKAIDILLAD